MTGHHGEPPKIGVSLPLDKPFELCDQEAALAFVTAVSQLLLGDNPTFPAVDPAKIGYASWWLAGFAVLCDWLGSNRNHFPYKTAEIPLQTYWERTRPPTGGNRPSPIPAFYPKPSPHRCTWNS